MEKFMPCVYAFLSCLGFCYIFEVRKPKFILLSCLTGAVGWGVFLLTEGAGSEVVRYFAATVAVAVLSEILARVMKAPATIFLVIGIIPMVPGGGLYYTMDYLINGDFAMFAYRGLKTAAYAGAIAVGVSMVTSLSRMLTWGKAHHS